MPKNQLLAMNDSEFNLNMQDLVKAYVDEMRRGEDKLKAIREQAELDAAAAYQDAKEKIQNELDRLAQEGAIKTEYERAQYAKKLADELKTQRLADELEVLNAVSKKAEDERRKELKVLEHKKKVAQAEKAVQEARAKGDKKAEEKAKKELVNAQKEQSKSASDGISEALDKRFEELNRQLEQGTAVSETAAKNTETAMKSVGRAITEGLNAINNSIKAYAQHQTAINARLNGVSSYSSIAKSLNSIAFSPLFKAEDLYGNVAELAGQGIATNIEQRALLMTVKDGIATTFDATSDSLKRIIRIQQNDSTAARMGLEAYLTEFLNVYVENTEYLQSTFDTVASSLLEASAMLKYNTSDVAASLEFEYQVQKWLGTLTGLGLSDQAAQAIAEAIGQLGSGSVDALTSSDINNLLLMGANKVGNISYADLLSEGVTAQNVNDLMYGMVSYMQEIASFESNIVKNQLAKTFGLTVSDVLSSKNVSAELLKEIKGDSLDYGGMYGALEEGFDQLPARLGISNILDNLMSNFTYQIGANIAANPALFALWKLTDLIKVATNGEDIAIPFISAYGTGFDLNTGVANLMQMAIAGTSILAGIPSIISGVASAVNGSSLLDRVGISENNAVIQQVTGGLSKQKNGKRESGDSTSGGRTVTNNDENVYQDTALNDANDDAKKQVDAQKEEEEDPVVKYLSKDIILPDRLDKILAALLRLNGFNITNGTGEDGSFSFISYTQLETLLNPETFFLPIVDKFDILLEHSEAIKQALAEGVVVKAEPAGQTSILSNQSTSSETVLGQTGVSTNLFIDSNEFAEGFRDIVRNVAALSGDKSTAQGWNEPISGGNANSQVATPGNSSSNAGDIAGLTQANNYYTLTTR